MLNLQRRPCPTRPIGVLLRNAIVGVSVSIASLILFIFLAELSLRSFSSLLPAGIYCTEVFDPDLNAYVFGSPVIYNKQGYVVRAANQDGFLDVDHQLTKQPGVIRVGFLGDSYVEAVQVPLEQTFWRNIPRKLSSREIETMAFGKSGWGTLNSLLAYRKYGKRYGLDIVIYLFVKNDPGDHLFEIQKTKWAAGWKPSAVLAENDVGYEIQWRPYPDDSPFTSRLLKWSVDRSLVMRIFDTRIRLILSSWLDRGPNQNDLPSTWPADLLGRAKLLSRRILTQLRDEVRSEGGHFAVLYVPRGAAELEERLELQDTWYHWLAEILADLRVPLIDPTNALRARAAGGDAVYADHWTPAGHDVIATVLANYLANHLVPDTQD